MITISLSMIVKNEEDTLGEYELSYRHNKIALSYRPDDQGVINNVRLLEEIINMKSH